MSWRDLFDFCCNSEQVLLEKRELCVQKVRLFIPEVILNMCGVFVFQTKEHSVLHETKLIKTSPGIILFSKKNGIENE